MKLQNFFLTLLLVMSVAHAQDSEAEAPAKVSFFLFLKGGPLSEISVKAGDQYLGSSDSFGNIELELNPGDYELNFFSESDELHTQNMTLRSGELVQMILDFKAKTEAPLVDLESSLGDDDSQQVVEQTEEQKGELTVLKGVVTSAEDQTAIANAKIFISGVSGFVNTNENGEFELELNSGTYNVSVLHSQFNSQIESNLDILPGQDNQLNLELTPVGSEMPEFVVVEPFIEGSLASVLEERKNNNSVANYLSMEQISKSGDSDAAGALKRVTGLTLVDGKFIFIRGLGERYSSTLLNGLNLPSPDPTRRVVPLDLFPTGIIESIEVQKGYSSSLPAEFGGGTVVLKTISIPDSNFLKASISYGHNTQTTDKDGLTYAGGSNDWTGFDDGTRAIPQLLADAIEGDTELRPNNPFFDGGFSREELELIGESLNSNYNIYNTEIDPGLGFSLSGGMRHETDSGPILGFSAALEYGNDFQTRSELRRSFVVSGGDNLSLDSEEISDTTSRNISLSGFLTTGIEFNELNKFSANYMVLRSTQDLADLAEGFNEDLGNSRRIYEIRWTERELSAFQMEGDHTLNGFHDIQFQWQYSDSNAFFDEPDNRIYRYDQREEGDFVFSTRNDSNSRVFRELNDNSKNIRYDIKAPISFEKHDLVIKAGQNWTNKDRDSDIRRFVFEDVGVLTNDVDDTDILDNILNPTFIAPNGYQLIEVTRATDNYFANLDIKADYLALDYSYKELFRASIGVRRENFNQSVTTFRLFDPDQSPITASLQDDDYFPAFSSTLFLPKDNQIRVNYSETATRPDFKELSSAQFKDPVLDRNVIGNPDLQTGSIKHYDLRWDKYFSSGEFLSLSLFYKQFFNPIEIIILPGSSRVISFDNADSAENSGIEFEIYKDFSFMGEKWADFYVSSNFAWIESEIQLSEDRPSGQTNSNRPLQGQSPYVVNVQFGYDNNDKGISSSLLFNVFGERISEAGTSGKPDIYEQPFNQLDFVYSQKLWEGWKLSFKAKNLLNDKVLFLQGEETTREYTKGRGYSIGISYQLD